MPNVFFLFSFLEIAKQLGRDSSWNFSAENTATMRVVYPVITINLDGPLSSGLKNRCRWVRDQTSAAWNRSQKNKSDLNNNFFAKYSYSIFIHYTQNKGETECSCEILIYQGKNKNKRNLNFFKLKKFDEKQLVVRKFWRGEKPKVWRGIDYYV
jgi:hypothetical protein